MGANAASRLNDLIACCPPFTEPAWRAQLDWVHLPAGQVLNEAERPVTHAYFPTTAIVALVLGLADGASAELALVGREGLVGLSAFLGGESMTQGAVVLSAGHAYRIAVPQVQRIFSSSEVTRQVLLRFTQALITQMAQTVVCNRHHQLEQRLCRLLLLSLDRSRDTEVALTHEAMAQMLCVRREGVTEAALALRNKGLIRYARGRIEVLDRGGLEGRVCECYRVVAAEYGRLLSAPPLAPALAWRVAPPSRPSPPEVPQRAAVLAQR